MFITMEYMPLGDLKQHMSRRFTTRETRQIISQVLEGIASMHESGFAHRDLKPAVSLEELLRSASWKLSDGMIS